VTPLNVSVPCCSSARVCRGRIGSENITARPSSFSQLTTQTRIAGATIQWTVGILAQEQVAHKGPSQGTFVIRLGG